MESTPPGRAGFTDSLRALGAGLLTGAEDRLRLLSLEVQEEKFRLIQTFIWISAAVFTGMLAVTFASLTLVCLFWESARVTVLTLFTLLYTGSLVAILLALRRYLAAQPPPFAATLHELGEDRACIRPEN